jgi:hypothetical protein
MLAATTNRVTTTEHTPCSGSRVDYCQLFLIPAYPEHILDLESVIDKNHTDLVERGLRKMDDGKA